MVEDVVARIALLDALEAEGSPDPERIGDLKAELLDDIPALLEHSTQLARRGDALVNAVTSDGWDADADAALAALAEVVTSWYVYRKTS